MFDYVIFGDVLEHLREPAEVLAGCREWLKPGGRIVVSVPNMGWIGAVLPLIHGGLLRSDSGTFDRTHLRVYNAATLVAEVEGAGFRVIEVKWKCFDGTQEWPGGEGEHVFQWENVVVRCDRDQYNALTAYQVLLVAEAV
jgi:2-polyprenyl-3-methyl-5-hydroxy-6-metoxy-1,4-benzoquinol methylase